MWSGARGNASARKREASSVRSASSSACARCAGDLGVEAAGEGARVSLRRRLRPARARARRCPAAPSPAAPSRSPGRQPRSRSAAGPATASSLRRHVPPLGKGRGGQAGAAVHQVQASAATPAPRPAPRAAAPRPPLPAAAPRPPTAGVRRRKQPALHLQHRRARAPASSSRPAVALALQLGELRAVQGEVRFPPARAPRRGAAARSRAAPAPRGRAGRPGTTRSRRGPLPASASSLASARPLGFAQRRRRVAGRGAGRRRAARTSSAPASSATAGVAQSSAVAAVKRGRSSTKSP